jgi:hypothetical protein
MRIGTWIVTLAVVLGVVACKKSEGSKSDQQESAMSDMAEAPKADMVEAPKADMAEAPKADMAEAPKADMAEAASTLTRDQVLDAIAKKVCEALQKKDLSKTTKDQREAQLGISIIGAYGSNPEYAKVVPVNLADEKASEAFGAAVGIKMAVHCPDTLVKASE